MGNWSLKHKVNIIAFKAIAKVLVIYNLVVSPVTIYIRMLNKDITPYS